MVPAPVIVSFISWHFITPFSNPAGVNSWGSPTSWGASPSLLDFSEFFFISANMASTTVSGSSI